MSAINLLPNLRKPWYNIGIIKMYQKKYKEAWIYFNKAKILDPSNINLQTIINKGFDNLHKIDIFNDERELKYYRDKNNYNIKFKFWYKYTPYIKPIFYLNYFKFNEYD